ncbi:MAG: helix-turn-helix transcriptional regulator [Trueperaceae bacterium]|nr:MAG: helix-turn-helix transcriptional regulator [Trueperaceae bacterium]
MIKVKLSAYLEREGITVYQLAQRVEGLSPKSVYTYANGTRNPSLDSLDKLVTALRELTDKPVEVSDLLEYQQEDRAQGRDAKPSTWQTLAGLCTDPDAPRDMSLNHDRYLDEALAEEYRRSVKR